MANNPYVNKVELADGSTLIDLTSDTVEAGKMLSGTTAHDASGASVTGSIANGIITNNTSGGTSSGTINRGSQIKIGAGYYPNDAYYTAQANSGTKTITSAGDTSVDGYETAYVRTASNVTMMGGILTTYVGLGGFGITFSDTTDTSGITVVASSDATVTDIRIVPSINGWFTGATYNGQESSDTHRIYLTGAQITAPQTGTRTFTVTVPNGSSTVNFVFNVDSSGNVTITES